MGGVHRGGLGGPLPTSLEICPDLLSPPLQPISGRDVGDGENKAPSPFAANSTPSAKTTAAIANSINASRPCNTEARGNRRCFLRKMSPLIKRLTDQLTRYAAFA